jgi:hypothetical protein
MNFKSVLSCFLIFFCLNCYSQEIKSEEEPPESYYDGEYEWYIRTGYLKWFDQIYDLTATTFPPKKGLRMLRGLKKAALLAIYSNEF